MTQGHDRLTALQPKGNSTITYRPIAPSSAPQKILPRPETFDDDKRKWSSTFQDSEHSPILSSKLHFKKYTFKISLTFVFG